MLLGVLCCPSLVPVYESFLGRFAVGCWFVETSRGLGERVEKAIKHSFPQVRAGVIVIELFCELLRWRC